MTVLRLALLLVLAPSALPIETGWRPITSAGHSLRHGPTLRPSLGPTMRPLLGPGPTALVPRTLGFHHQGPHRHPNMCTLYKAVLDQDTFQQYVQYKTQIPDLKEFTLCLWHMSYNHTQDQPLFYYSHRDKPREIYSWVANSDSASFYMLAINGQTLYRLNYPVRLQRWYHVCQSWNGKTGEWQIWVNAERIGRGFHNLLVGKPVRGGGVAVTGQSQKPQQGPGSVGHKAQGLLGEVTLVQLYKAALTAGKAYTNHKHHHVHHFHHDDKPGEDDYAIMSPSTPAHPQQSQMQPQPQPQPQQQGTQFSLLSNGQLIPMLPVSELTLPNFRLFSPYNTLNIPVMQRLFKRDQSKSSGTAGKRMKKSEEISEASVEDAEVEDILKVDLTKETKKVKRDTTLEVEGKIVTEEVVSREGDEKTLDLAKRQAFEDEEDEESEEKNHKKRTLFQEQFQFGLVPGDDLSSLFPGNGYILGGGGVKFDGEEEGGKPQPTEMVQMEPAEWEVRSIMEVCSGCSEDPFRKASIISWRETPKKLYAGAAYVPANPECQRF